MKSIDLIKILKSISIPSVMSYLEEEHIVLLDLLRVMIDSMYDFGIFRQSRYYGSTKSKRSIF